MNNDMTEFPFQGFQMTLQFPISVQQSKIINLV